METDWSGRIARGFLLLWTRRNGPNLSSYIKIEDFDLWHQTQKVMSLIIIEIAFDRTAERVCDMCPRAKQTRAPFPFSYRNASARFDLVNGDVRGPYQTASSAGAHYFLTLVDDHNHCVWVYLMKNKSETWRLLTGFYNMIKTQFGRQIKVFRSDNGLEFTSEPMKGFYWEKGIINQTSSTDTPPTKRKGRGETRHLLNIARVLRFQANLPTKFRGNVFLHLLI